MGAIPPGYHSCCRRNECEQPRRHTVGANRATYGLGWLIYDRLLQFGVKTLPGGGLSYDYFKLEPQLAESWVIAPDNCP